jgi:hypothetical protein
MLNVFRVDKGNAGDWHSPPFKYFDFHSSKYKDIANDFKQREGIVVVGGGGLGIKTFKRFLPSLRSSSSVLIGWGVGVDEFVDKDQIIKDQGYDLIGGWFDSFDEVGIRVYSKELESKENYRWVPCSSCMSDLFSKYKSRKPESSVGVYSHKRVLLSGFRDSSRMTNSGDNLEEKLEFLSRHEYIVTNTYHGVYWATLLGRKVVCLPFKSGLFSFKHKPAYSTGAVTDQVLHKATSYPDSLEECRNQNIQFFDYLREKYPQLKKSR